MKNLLLALVILLSVSIETEAVPKVNKKKNCRLDFTSTTNDTAPVATLKADILQGIWHRKVAHSNIEVIYTFNAYGSLEQTVIYEDGHTATNRHKWQLKEIEGITYLVIKDIDLGENLYYAIEQSCDGLILTDTISFEETTLFFKPKASKTTIDRIGYTILGQWKHEGYPFDISDDAENYGTLDTMEETFFNYNFKKDGTFERSIGMKEVLVKEKGFWEVSADGDYLIFHLSKDGRKKNVYTSQYARLFYVDQDHLQLEQALTTIGEYKMRFGTQQKMFVFKKATLTAKGSEPN